MKEIVLKEAGEVLESGRKRKIPYERTGEIPAILRLPKARSSYSSTKVGLRKIPAHEHHTAGTQIWYQSRGPSYHSEGQLSKTFVDPGETLETEKALDEPNWFSIVLNAEIYGN